MKTQNNQRNVEPFFEIPYYHDFISPTLARHLLSQAATMPGVDGLRHIGATGGLETAESLSFLVTLYQRVKPKLAKVLAQRILDRKFIDERARACFEFNEKLHRDFLDPDYKTVIGLEDTDGRIVVGPKSDSYCTSGGNPVAPIPDYLQGPHVTLFGPPDSAKMAINAMNAYHRKLKGEPAIIEELLATQNAAPKWGADDEDSKTPLRQDLIDAGVNLTGCFDGTLTLKEGNKNYELASTHLSAPMKRFPGLALPCTFLFYKDSPIPLHLYDFALHLFKNWHNPKSLSFYVPKLENEEEARYIHTMIATAEEMIKARHPEYKLGTIRLMIVLENPRAILRTHEIMDALHPYFVGASLGWHDYLASTARLFKEDSNYRIPVKADPNIVIKYIKASHSLLADVVGSRGGVKVGGMYGILPQSTDITSPSFQVALKGFFKDVITQLKRDLTGYWVAHPDFVRLGLAIIEAWRRYEKGDHAPLFKLTKEIFSESYRKEVDAFIRGEDIKGLDPKDPNYVRSLLVADIKESDYVPNNHPDEIRYNLFQSLQYITDWLSGNGCVALPTIIDGIPVRVMDDLATAERSRWEVWHEIYHGRFKLEDFLRIAQEEMRFIRKDLSDEKKIVQVKWDERTEKWYPVAFKLMVQLMAAKTPVEFASELLLPFTVPEIRNDLNPWAKVQQLDPLKYKLDSYIERWNYYFECCGSESFASQMAAKPFLDRSFGESVVNNFSVSDIVEAASFHGDIGESPKTLDGRARVEQQKASESSDEILGQLRDIGLKYRDKFGFKFLVFAQGRSGKDLLDALKTRILNSKETEIKNAQDALWSIALKRMNESPVDSVFSDLSEIAKKYKVTGSQVAVTDGRDIQPICWGDAVRGQSPVNEHTLFELASLSKTLASAFAMEFFAERGIRSDASVNKLFAEAKSKFRLKSLKGDSSWADAVSVQHLMSHSALNMHYVKGFPKTGEVPSSGDILIDGPGYGYEPVDIISEPGSVFKYSGAGFLVLEHLMEVMSGKKIKDLTKDFLGKISPNELTFEQHDILGRSYADGYFDDGKVVPGGRLLFPAFAAGAMGSAEAMLGFLRHLGRAYVNLEGSGPISHDTARLMLHGRDLGCRDFMGCDMGLGVFVAEAGDNRLAVHQGANEGFRAIYVHCFAGPDSGKGFVVLCNADNSGVLYISEVTQLLLKRLDVSGIDFARFAAGFDYSKLGQEQIVNLGYKKLIFDAFKPMLPEVIQRSGRIDPLAKYNLLTDASVRRVTNHIFARAENVFNPGEPEYDPALYGRQGKIMDSWESTRHNPLPFDMLDLDLRVPGTVSFVKLSTKYHDGNQAQAVRILGRDGEEGAWSELLPKTPMDGHGFRLIKLPAETSRISQVRIEMHPDGGLTRVGLYSSLPNDLAKDFVPLAKSFCQRYSEPVPKGIKPMTLDYDPSDAEIQLNVRRAKRGPFDFASAALGARIISATNEHYSPAKNVISPFPPLNMFDGMESSRSRTPDHFDEVVLALSGETDVGRIILDFKYFVNNNPLYVQVFAKRGSEWVDIAGRLPVKAFAGNRKEIRVSTPMKTGELKIRTYPDGGINRIQVFAKD
jgi:allantoicase/malate synthase/CubicO group peptidase (beta-lactamase class C family)